MRMDFQAMTNGILAGAVTITACCNCVEPWAALIIGILGSLVYSAFCKVLDYFQIDDPMDAFQVHGACGFMGCLCVALFEKDVGVMYDQQKGWPQFGIQLLGCVAIIAWVSITSALFFFVVKFAVQLKISKEEIFRLSEQDEILGGDLYYFGPIKFEG